MAGNMDFMVLVMMLVIIIEIIGTVTIFQKRLQKQKLKIFFTVIIGIVIASQIFAIVMFLIFLNVFEQPSPFIEKSIVQDPSSPIHNG